MALPELQEFQEEVVARYLLLQVPAVAQHIEKPNKKQVEQEEAWRAEQQESDLVAQYGGSVADTLGSVHTSAGKGDHGTHSVDTAAGNGEQVTTPKGTPARKGKHKTTSGAASAGKDQSMVDTINPSILPAPPAMPTLVMRDHKLHGMKSKLEQFINRNMEADCWCCTNIDGSRIEIRHLTQEQIKDIGEKTSEFMMQQIKEETGNCNKRANLPHSSVGHGQKQVRRMYRHIEDDRNLDV